MSSPDDFNLFLPEDYSSRHISITNKSSQKLYLTSLNSGSNEESNILYHNVWHSHNDLLNDETQDLLSESVYILLENSSSNDCSNWRSSLVCEDVISILEESLPDCSTCKADTDNLRETLDMFIKNDSCVCDLGMSRNSSISHITKATDNYNSTKHHTLNHRHNQSTTEEILDSKQIFKPKFGISQNAKIESCSSKDCDINCRDTIILEKEEEENRAHRSNVAKITFKTAKEQLLASNPAIKRTLGASRKASAKFVSPMIGAQDKQESDSPPQIMDDRLKHLDPKMIELIESEIIDKGTPIGWNDIAGLQMAKSVIQEAVVWPLLRPDIFTGLRRPPKGILLFGPPGTGKTLIGKCVAAQCRATFFSISASSLTSKWLGDGEKMVRALFAVARCHQPAVVFIDEIDSLLTQRSDSEHEATRRIKTEFLVQFDGAATAEEDRILIVGATNRPQELDEAARRRLVKRLYIPLPDACARKQIISNLLKTENNELSTDEISKVAGLTEGYSGADMKSLCSEAAMGPIRAVPLEQIISIQRDKVRPVMLQDFVTALERVRPSVSEDDLGQYVKWNKTYGQGF